MLNNNACVCGITWHCVCSCVHVACWVLGVACGYVFNKTIAIKEIPAHTDIRQLTRTGLDARGCRFFGFRNSDAPGAGGAAPSSPCAPSARVNSPAAACIAPGHAHVTDKFKLLLLSCKALTHSSVSCSARVADQAPR